MAPNPAPNGQMRAKNFYTLCAPGIICAREPFVALQLDHMSEKRPENGQKWPKFVLLVSNRPKTKNGPNIGLRGSKPHSEGTYSTRNPPRFVVSKRQSQPMRGLDPRTSGHLVEPEGSPARARWWPTVGPARFPGRKKGFLSKLFPDHLGHSKKLFWLVSEPVVTHFGPWKIPNLLENGPLWVQ